MKRGDTLTASEKDQSSSLLTSGVDGQWSLRRRYSLWRIVFTTPIKTCFDIYDGVSDILSSQI